MRTRQAAAARLEQAVRAGELEQLSNLEEELRRAVRRAGDYLCAREGSDVHRLTARAGRD